MKIGSKRRRDCSETTRIYAYGVYDLFHLGHMRAFGHFKEVFPNSYLIVGVLVDKKAVMSVEERASAVDSCKWVDEVIISCPEEPTPAFLESLAIDITILPSPPSIKVGKFVVMEPTLELDDMILHRRAIKKRKKIALRCIRHGIYDIGFSSNELFDLKAKNYKKMMKKRLENCFRVMKYKQTVALNQVLSSCQGWMDRFVSTFDYNASLVKAFFSVL